jgi:hypothetical protein
MRVFPVPTADGPSVGIASHKLTSGPVGLPLFNIQIALAESLGGRE